MLRKCDWGVCKSPWTAVVLTLNYVGVLWFLCLLSFCWLPTDWVHFLLPPSFIKWMFLFCGGLRNEDINLLELHLKLSWMIWRSFYESCMHVIISSWMKKHPSNFRSEMVPFPPFQSIMSWIVAKCSLVNRIYHNSFHFVNIFYTEYHSSLLFPPHLYECIYEGAIIQGESIAFVGQRARGAGYCGKWWLDSFLCMPLLLIMENLHNFLLTSEQHGSLKVV